MLEGEANDYVGKSLSGGRIVIRPPADDAGDPCLAGNTVLYGATAGELFCAGAARASASPCATRERPRSSKASATMRCEYMTSGTVVVLGGLGRNLGAGMTGGEAFVHDPRGAPAAR